MPPVGGGLPPRRKSRPLLWLWIIAGVLLIAVMAFVLMMFRSTTITVIPRVHTIVFDSTKSFTAYPTSSAAAGTLTYTLQSFDIDDSQSVTSIGTTHVERKASGSVTVVNTYSSAPVKLVKNTRFQTPDGLIFRTPADISIPGMRATAPGTVQISLVADQTSDKYNIAPVSRFTLPGLQGGPMYDKVYAQSRTAFSGGFSGNEPTVDANTKAAAVAEMQGRLRDKVMQQIGALNPNNCTAFPSFAAVTFQDAPPTLSTTSGQVNLNERAHVDIPILPSQALDQQLGGITDSDVQNSTLALAPKQGFTATLSNTTSTMLGSSPITFVMSGSAQLVWSVDQNALSQALAGKDQSAFQTVVNGFPGVQEARARIEPFWRHTFPADPKEIKVIISAPQESSGQ